MFASSFSELSYLNRQLRALRPDQLSRLARWLGPKGLPNFIFTPKFRKKLIEPLDQSSPKLSDKDLDLSSCSQVSLFRESDDKVDLFVRQHNTEFDLFSNVKNDDLNKLKKRPVWKANLAGLHRIFLSISTITNRLAQEFSSDLRFLLQVR